MREIIFAVSALAALGLIFGILLAWASKKFHVEEDPRVVKIKDLLPGVNCGACGLAGCGSFAEAIIEGKTDISYCVACNEDSKTKIAEVLGLSSEGTAVSDKKIAVIACGGGNRCKSKFEYKGIYDCRVAAVVLGGHKECSAACVEQGSCITICPFDAIEMTPEGIPQVIMSKCKGCEKCVAVCPLKIISMVGVKKRVYIRCSSHEKGAQVMKKCKVGCIGCGKCVEICPVKAITIDNFLAVIDFDKCISCRKCVDVCPTKAIAIT